MPDAPTPDTPAPGEGIIEVQFTVQNQTPYELTLDKNRSTGVDYNAWPGTLPPNGTAQFTQGGNFQVLFNAWYQVVDNPTAGAEVDFYGYWTAGWLHDAGITCDPSNLFPGSETSAQTFACTYTVKP